jgi:hypothetical protein
MGEYFTQARRARKTLHMAVVSLMISPGCFTLSDARSIVEQVFVSNSSINVGGLWCLVWAWTGTNFSEKCKNGRRIEFYASI